MDDELVRIFFQMLNNIRLYHWLTHSYARHTGSGALYDSLSDLIDKFVETYMGKYERPVIKNAFNVKVQPFSDSDMMNVLQGYVEFLSEELPKYLEDWDTDLLNIRDEMLGELNKTLYLFSLQ